MIIRVFFLIEKYLRLHQILFLVFSYFVFIFLNVIVIYELLFKFFLNYRRST